MGPGTGGVAPDRAGLPHRRAARLALPAIASHITVPLVGLVDTAMLGHFGTTADLGAVGLGAAVSASVFWVFAFLRPGTTSLVGRALGAGSQDDAVRHLQRALALAGGLGAAWLALQWLVVPGLVRLLAHGADAGPLAADYALIRGLSLPGVLVTLAVIGYFVGAQDTRTPLVVAGTVAGLNVLLDAALVAGLGWGVHGAAWATFAAEWAGAALAIVLLRRALGPHRWALLRAWRDPALRRGWRALLAMNGALVARTGLLMAAITVVASIGSRFGDEVLAANAILLQMMYLSSYALDGYATAAESMAAHEAGRRDHAAFHRANAAAAVAGLAIAGALSLAWWLGREPILSTLTGIEPVQDAARAYWWAAVALPVASAAAWILDGIYLGVGRSRAMLASMAFSVLAVFAPILVLGAQSAAFANGWVWAAFLAMNVSRAVTLGARYAVLTRRRAWFGATMESSRA